MSIFKAIGAWFAKAFKSIKTDGAKIAVAITEGLQTALKSGVVAAIADLIGGIFPNVKNLPAEIVADLEKLLPKILAAELAVEGLPDSPTQQDIADFESRVLAAFGVTDNKSKLYSTLAAQIYGIIQSHVGAGSYTFAELVADVEQAYQDYVADKAEQDAADGVPGNTADGAM